MIAWKRAIALSMLTAVPILGNANCPSSETWIGTSSNGWNDTNWSPGCIPGQTAADTDIAIFGPNVGAFGSTISLDTPAAISPGLSQLVFNDSKTSFNISSPSGANHLHFNGLTGSSGLFSFITVEAGSHSITAPITLDDTILNIQNNDPNGALTVFSGLISANSSMIITGPGAFLVQNNAVPGVGFTVTGTMSIVSGTFSNINTNPVTGAAVGSQVAAESGFNIDGGNVFLSNIGPISGTCGSHTGADTGDFIIKSGTLTLFNRGAVTGSPSRGTQLAGPVALIIAGGLVRATNHGPVSPNTVALPNSGTFVEFNQLIMSGGQFVNSGPLSTNSAAIGSLIQIADETLIDGGILINDDTFQGGAGLGIQVFPGGTLSGTGVYQGIGAVQTLVVANAGTVTPQNAGGVPGTMTIQGAYAQTSSGNLVINIGPAGTGLLNVTSNTAGFGTAQLDGTLTLNLASGATFPLHTNIPIVTTSNGLIGSFSRIVNNIPNLTPVFTVDPNHNLLVAFSPKPNAAHTVFNFSQIIFSKMNQKNMRIQNYIWRLVRTIVENEQINNTYPCVAGTSASTNRMTASAEPADYASDPKMIASITSIGGPYATEFSDSALIAQDPSKKKKKRGMTVEQELQELLQEIQNPPIPNPADIYFGPTFGISNTLTKKGQVGSTNWSAGATAGFDYAFPVGGIGVTADFSHTKGFTKRHGGTFRTDGADLSVYGAYVPPSLPELSISTILGGGYQWNSFPSITGPTNNLIAKGHAHGWDYNINLSGQFMFLNNLFPQVPQSLQFGVKTSLQFCHSHTDGYTEHGAGSYDMIYFPSHSNSLRTDLGFIISYIIQWNIASMVPQLSIDWQRECLKQSSISKTVPADTPDATPTLSPSKGPGRNYMDISFDLLTMFYNQFGVDINWGFEWNDTSHDHSFMLSGKFKF